MFENSIPVEVLRNDEASLLDRMDRHFDSKIFIDFDRHNNSEILLKLAEKKLFTTKRNYLIVGSDLKQFKNKIQSVPIFVNSAIKFVELNYNKFPRISVFGIRNLGQTFGGNFEYPLLVEFEWSNKELVKKMEYKPDEMSDWSKITLPIGIVSHVCKNSSNVTTQLLDWYTKEVDTTKDATPRLGYLIFEAVQKTLKFK